ncbi:MAG: hypothetical protein PVI38_20445 [Desulfobacterales bacterium]|jgi:hypothetical protein
MKPQKEVLWMNNMSLPHPTALDLRGRQSVRATFRLSPAAIEALSVVAAQLGIKQKSIFDHLIEDAQSLMRIAAKIDDESLKDKKRVQKTFVISRKSLASLETAAQKANASRDALVELSIRRLMPIISRERQKHRMRKEILKQMKHFLDKGIELLTEFESDLGDDDPTTIQFKSAIKALSSAHKDISAFIEKGDIIENFDLQRVSDSTRQRDGQVNDLKNN